MSPIERNRIEELFERERERFAARHPRSRELHERAGASLLSGVPMNWMTRWPGSFPVFFESASGAEVTDVDGHVYADLCLGDTGAMTGHSPPATVAAVRERIATGITAMLPTEDAIAVGEEPDTVEDVLEPYLLQQGLLKRTPRGRVLTQRAYDHLGLRAPQGAASLF